jgi:hypothetical protein
MRANTFNGLSALLRNFFLGAVLGRLWSHLAPCGPLDRRVAVSRRRRASFDALWLVVMTIPSNGSTLSAPFRFGFDGAQKQRKRNESFAKRNEPFRNAGRKSLKPL